MSKARFTKGKWEVDFLDNECEAEVFTQGIFPEARWYICTVYDAADNARLSDNAHLIAAAPEMYEMLERASIALEDDYSAGQDFIDEIEHLLAKARGEQ